ncbi:hypothetical protein BSKO_10081 [Bryopsis sp. KO-2023]|nr:hypothetical protein BSKO_10081 [Bryopsis sp. KO-2023]
MSAFALFLVASEFPQGRCRPFAHASQHGFCRKGNAVLRFAIAGVVAAVQAGEVPSSEACDTSAMAMGADDFVLRALGGLLGQSVLSVSLTLAGMCNVDFFSGIMMALPAHSNIDPTRYVDMLEKCGVPVAGKTTCPGVDQETPVEPVMQAQILLKKKKIIGALALKAAAGKALGTWRALALLWRTIRSPNQPHLL